MFKRINNYLLTHYPLLWNTRIVWVLLANVTLHLLFFLGGLASVNARSFSSFYSVWDVGGGSLMTFSTLCTLVVLIVWCVFYLRNNAFKSFYRLPTLYLAKEFLIIVLLLFSSTTYYLSFHSGVKARVRSITGEAVFIREVNKVNEALTFVPLEKPAYFLLNTCEARHNRLRNEPEELPVADTTLPNYPETPALRQALRQPNAFSFANYCKLFYSGGSYWRAVDTSQAISNRVRSWLNGGRQDSVRLALRELFGVLKKYGIAYRLSEEELVRAVFSNSYFSIGALVPGDRFTYDRGLEAENSTYLKHNDLYRALDFVESCQWTAHAFSDVKLAWSITGYISLSLSILLLCYRRFSKNVFLISMVGTLVWAIVISLLAIGAGGGASGLAWFLLLLTAVFLAMALGLLAQRGSKRTVGVLLNWHSYLLPYVVVLIIGLVTDAYRSREYQVQSMLDNETYMRLHYPVGHWVVQHATDIALFNLLLAIVYLAVLFNRWARAWQAMPEE